MAGLDPLAEIKGYRRISDEIATAGQPTDEQLHRIAAAGFNVVINLGLHDAAYALNDEQSLVESLNLCYEHIPVLWEQPTLQNFQDFVKVMHLHSGQKQFIHCAANKRVSVFLALYQICICGMSRAQVLDGLESFWAPNAIWQHFMGQVLQEFRPGSPVGQASRRPTENSTEALGNNGSTNG